MTDNTETRSFSDHSMSQTDLERMRSIYGESYTPYEWVFGGQCAVCKKPFEGMHLLSQVTCGDTCRKRLQRQRQREKEAMIKVMSEPQLIRGAIKRKERIPEFISELNRLKGEINDLLLLAGDSDQKSKHEMMQGLKNKHP